MVKKIVFLIITLLLIVGAGALVSVAPYHIYTLTLTEGVNTRFLVMKPTKAVLYDGQEFIQQNIQKVGDDSSLYAQFHFSNFQIPMPFNHPVFSMIPTIKMKSTGPELGASFLDGRNAELFSFMVEKTYKLETISGDQKLFLLPVFKNHIARKSEEELWRDLFFKKLSLPSNLGESFFHSLLALREVTYSDLVYNLYVLYNRTHFFPAETLRISFDPLTNHGIIELPSEDPKFKVERLFIIEKGFIYSMTLKTRIDNLAAENFRQKILKEAIYKNSTVDSAIPIYAQYKNISYSKRIDQQGMTYLYAAWSHDLANREYIRVIILFLERGKSNLKFLRPFYEYAFKRFGSNLSSADEFRLETADEKLKRRMKEELEGEIKKEETENRPKFEGNFSNPDEKIKFYLQKAKESKTNSDDSEKVLLQE
ncbi:MAG: hypothetical protein ACXVLQ_01870 [Bacteriovorax sp.]